MAPVRMDPALERLWLDVETERIRLRARYAGISLSPRATEDVKRTAVEWIRDGCPVDDEGAYLEWLERQSGRGPRLPGRPRQPVLS